MKKSSTPTAGASSAPRSGSAYLLVKKCPDGRTINLNIYDESELQEHVEAMWRYTPDYHLVAVIPLPNR